MDYAGIARSMSGMGEFHGERVFGSGVFFMARMPGKREYGIL